MTEIGEHAGMQQKAENYSTERQVRRWEKQLSGIRHAVVAIVPIPLEELC